MREKLKMKIWKIIKSLFGYKEEKIPEYPLDFIIIDYSPIALRENILDNQNKIIYRYSIDGFGNMVLKKYRYSKERLISLTETYNLPFYDKTKKEIRFPVFAKILPGEIEYTV